VASNNDNYDDLKEKLAKMNMTSDDDEWNKQAHYNFVKPAPVVVQETEPYPMNKGGTAAILNLQGLLPDDNSKPFLRRTLSDDET